MSRVVIAALVALILYWTLPDTSDDPVAWCPNYATVRVMDPHWDPRRRRTRPVAVLPAACRDTTAVTFGYLRQPLPSFEP